MATATTPPPEVGDIPLTPVSSSNLAAIGYDADTRTIAVQFKNGHVFVYAGVHPRIWQEFEDCPSKGSFYSREIKGMYQGRKITGDCANCGDIGVLGKTCDDCGTAHYTTAT